MAKVITTELQHSGASGANITLDSSKNVTIEGNLTVDGTSTLTGAVTGDNAGAALTGSTDNTICTVTGANAIQGEANLTFDGTTLTHKATNDLHHKMESGTAGYCRICFGDADDDDVGEIMYNHANNQFHIKANNANPGYTLKSDQQSFFNVVNSYLKIDKNNTGVILEFVKSGTAVGNIGIGTSDTSYNTSSDYRLKENVVAISDGITRVKQLKPSKFNWIADDTNTLIDGFLAHEVSSVVPSAVTGAKDAVDSDSNPVHQVIDHSKMIPLLTAALKEAITEIETLKTKVAALEAG
jgi:hypothetical protein